MTPKILALLTFVLSLSFAAAAFLVRDFGGFRPDQFPVPQNDPPVQPAGYAFAIWGVIYLWLVLGMGFGLLRRADSPAWQAMRPPLCMSLAIGTLWLPVAMRSPIWAGILIWAMLLSALVALFRAPREDRLWAAYPVGLYAGWLSAASCVLLGLLTAGYGWVSAPTAALVFVFLALVLAAAVQSNLGGIPTYALAVIWALVAIILPNMTGDVYVAALAAGGAAALIPPAFKAWRADRQRTAS
ncbi:hypothetical protein [uncultured Roseobacter sp.]|uniref:hypothetical protein n=1 Tax=uncultured Roseobacter sp. TaxID=114847 RepID=UPI002635FD95|nr:hypothetical protein [uncultured Roseobacter sp.]